MQLHELSVRNFRALGEGRLTLDEKTTVLIGENGSGRSSLLEALALALGPGAADVPIRLQPYHFHRTEARADAPVAGPIHITLGFRERRPGEWDGLAGTPLAPLLQPKVVGRRELVLDIRGSIRGADESLAEWCLHRGDTASPVRVDNPDALACLRRISPLVWLRGGRLVSASVQPVPGGRTRSLSEEARELVARIEASHEALLAGTAIDQHEALTAGFEAARQFIGLSARHFGGRDHNFRQVVADILVLQSHQESTGPAVPRFTESTAERIGVLALTAALLGALPDRLEATAEPIWVIEDPEAHLHPMTLAAVLGLIGHIRWQKIILTQSGEVLAAEPLASLRRLVLRDGGLGERRVRPRALSAGDLRRVGYHLRGRRAVATFARCWLLVEGETEFWLLPDLARVAGYDFAVEGVACVEFAQSGLTPLITLARELGIEWHVLADGDRAGQSYVEQAARFTTRRTRDRRITTLTEPDIEHCFFEHGYEETFKRLAGEAWARAGARRIIARAIDRRSKPTIALELILEATSRQAAGVPAPLVRVIETCVALARESAGTGRPGTSGR
jgi:putative ATP-dependent endonuclease of OLD family